MVRASDSSVPAPFLELFLNDNSGTTLLKLGLVERLNTKWQRVQLETSLPPDVANKTGSLVAILGAFDGSNVGSDVLLDDVSISELP